MMSKLPASDTDPITKTFGVELTAEEIQEVSGADGWWPDITIEESEKPSIKVTLSAVEVTFEWD